MNVKTLSLVGALISLNLIFSGCTQQSRAKSWGGTADIDLPQHTKLVGATWKEEELWYLVRPMKEGDQPETLTLIESSSFGMIQGRVNFKESK